jgi:outer membrane protein assembly factor BamD (BamD/ComL family)
MRVAARWICCFVLLTVFATGCSTFGSRRTVSAADAPPARMSISDDSEESARAGSAVRQASFEEDSSFAPGELTEAESSFWDSISPTNLSKSAKQSYYKMTGTGPRPDLARQLYSAAEEQYKTAIDAPPDRRRSMLIEAASKYAAAAKRWPDSALEHDGLYMAGESYFFADAYPSANGMYEKLIKKYPGTKHMDTIDARRYSIAQYWLEMTTEKPENTFSFNYTDAKKPWRDTRGHALRLYDKIRIDDPTGKLADDATLAAGNAHFVSGNYFKADEYYGDLRKAFPGSEHQFKAHFLGLKTKLLCYQGSEYSGDALDEAEKIIKQMRKQFPRESEEEREFLTRAWAEVRFKKAQREWDTAQYFIRRGEYGAARLYQQTILKDYSDTPFAERAQEQLESQKEYPDEPPKRMEWLVDLFPREKPAKPLFYNDSPAPQK